MGAEKEGIGPKIYVATPSSHIDRGEFNLVELTCAHCGKKDIQPVLDSRDEKQAEHAGWVTVTLKASMRVFSPGYKHTGSHVPQVKWNEPASVVLCLCPECIDKYLTAFKEDDNVVNTIVSDISVALDNGRRDLFEWLMSVSARDRQYNVKEHKERLDL